MIDELVEKYYDNLNEMDIYIWQYLLLHRKQVSQSTIKSLSDTLNVSTTSILRFCQKIGLSGFSELKTYLKLSSSKELNVFDKSVYPKYIDNMNKVMTKMVELDLNGLFAKFYQARRVFIYATSSMQRNVASEFKRLLLKTNKKAYMISDSMDLDLILEGDIEDDLFVFISFSGDNEIAVNGCNVASRKTTTLGIACNENSKLAKISDYYLNVEKTYISKAGDYDFVTPYLVVIELFVIKYQEYVHNIENK